MRKHQVFSKDGLLLSETGHPFSEEEIRQERNRLLSDTDWMALSDNTMTPAWASYRQALRDISEQEGFPHNVTWPTKPE